MALAAQALEAQKASKPLEQGGALEQVAARMKRVMGLTSRLTGTVARSAEGTNAGHKNAEGMASICVRVQPPVRRPIFKRVHPFSSQWPVRPFE